VSKRFSADVLVIRIANNAIFIKVGSTKHEKNTKSMIFLKKVVLLAILGSTQPVQRRCFSRGIFN
jgi:hypothetical protein